MVQVSSEHSGNEGSGARRRGCVQSRWMSMMDTAIVAGLQQPVLLGDGMSDG